ncbi:YdeI family protein [Oceanicella sp. SM1341]|uniref:YdeI/OmpD-associated family protein n=1 Tax=Oceanicella sp. SM1341 TaxID=1548889 RepID=UPI000E4A00DC|nr:YdeI/OmpD-associated family protein [Oceanicella sp. SM1341]
MEDDPQAEAWFAGLTAWREELTALRALLRGCGLTETFKWRAPCYMAEGGNIAILGTLRDACVLSFFKGALLADPEGLLSPPGENTRSARLIRFTGPEEVRSREAALTACIREAVVLERDGARVAFAKDDLTWPEELTARLAQDDTLRAAFEALTPGRRRSWLLHFGAAKQSATRAARIERAAPRILQGKGLQER